MSCGYSFSCRYVPLFLVLFLFFSGCFSHRKQEEKTPAAAWMLLVPNAAYYWSDCLTTTQHRPGSVPRPSSSLAQLKQSLFAFTRHIVTTRWNINHEIIKTIHKNIKTSRQENKTSIHTPRLFSRLVSSTASKTFWCQERYFSEDDSLKWKNVCVVSPQREKPHRAVYKSINQQWETDGVTEDNHVLWSGD